MAAGGKAKTASKNNPTQRKKAERRMYNDKSGNPVPVMPVLFKDLDNRKSYMSAQYENGNLVEDQDGNPIKWDAVS